MSAEPSSLKEGKRFHLKVQNEWLLDIKDGKPNREKTIKRLCGKNGRMDLLIEDIDDYVSIIEIKNTDWERVKKKNINKNINRHINQIWSYIAVYIQNEQKDVCPGIIFPKIPNDVQLLNKIESKFNENGIQVVWYNESIENTKIRNSRNLTTAST